MKKVVAGLAATLALLAPLLDAAAAEPVHLYLRANGVDIRGESTTESLGRKDSIECFHYEQNVITAREAGSGMATGRRQYEPILCRKPIDRASPALLRALVENQRVDAVFRFYRPSPRVPGMTEHFQAVAIGDARIASVRQIVPDSTQVTLSVQPAMEEVTFVFHTISWTHATGGTTSDTWSSNR